MSGIPLFLLSFILVVCKSVISLIHIHFVRPSQSDSLHQEIVEVFKVIIVAQIIGFQPKPCQSCQSCQTHFDIEYYFLINPPFLVKNLLRMRAMAPSPVTLHAVPNESIAI